MCFEEPLERGGSTSPNEWHLVFRRTSWKRNNGFTLAMALRSGRPLSIKGSLDRMKNLLMIGFVVSEVCFILKTTSLVFLLANFDLRENTKMSNCWLLVPKKTKKGKVWRKIFAKDRNETSRKGYQNQNKVWHTVSTFYDFAKKFEFKLSRILFSSNSWSWCPSIVLNRL